MAFDPDAYLASSRAAPPAAFDPDAYLAANAPEKTYSAGQTFVDNATNLFGAGPVISGALHYVGTGGAAGSYASARDAKRADIEAEDQSDEHPWARRLGKLTALAGETAIGGGVGKAVGAGAKLAGATDLVAPWAKANPIISRVLGGAASGAAYGAASGAGTAASAGQDILPAAGEGAAIGGALGGAIGGVAGKAGQMLAGAPEAADANLLRGVSHGTGEQGSATVTARKLIERDKTDVLATLRSDPELARAVQKPAAEAMPLLKSRLEEVGSKLDPRYNVVDQVTGGVSVHNLVNFLNDEIAERAKRPLQEVWTNALEDIKRSVVRAWAPAEKTFNPEKLIEGGALDGMRSGDAVQLLERQLAAARPTGKSGAELLFGVKPFAGVNENIAGRAADLEAEIGRIREATSTTQRNLQVNIPTRDVRALVTQLQTRGTQVINPLNPGEASVMKAEVGGMLKSFLDSQLDLAAEQSPAAKAAVDGIRALNTTYSALSNMYKAVAQRGWKEGTGSTSTGGHLKTLLHQGGMFAAGTALMHGNVPGAVGALVGPRLIEAVPTVAREGVSKLAQLQRAAQMGNPGAVRLLRSLATGTQAGTAGAVGAATSGTLATQGSP